MQHRHLNHEDYTPAAIDNTVARGLWKEWADLRRAALAEPFEQGLSRVLELVLQVCRPHTADPYAQRHHFWMNYAEEHLRHDAANAEEEANAAEVQNHIMTQQTPPKYKNTSPLPDWERVMSSAARQGFLPDAVLVGGTASAIHAGHRFSRDADHVLTDLRARFEGVLAELESVAGWKTARVRRPVQILGSLDGIETGIRQLIRDKPLETVSVECLGQRITVPTEEEMLRIKGVLILKRNATRDYLDFVALARHIGDERTASALLPFDSLYPQPSGESALQQLQAQLAAPAPYDLDEVAPRFSEYKNLDPKWHAWPDVKAACARVATATFDAVCAIEEGDVIAAPR